MTADAIATASMVMGLDAAYQLVEANPKLEGYFIYATEDARIEAKYTKGVAAYLLN